MIGMNGADGTPLSGIDHLRQSIRDILTTPIGSRVMRRDYGSRLFELVDRPTTPALMVELYAATAEALDRWEPRFKLLEVKGETLTGGHITLDLTGRYLPDGREISLEGIVI